MKKSSIVLLLLSIFVSNAIYSMGRPRPIGIVYPMIKSPPIILKVDNQTNKDYVFDLGNKILPIGEKSTIKKVDLTQEWQGSIFNRSDKGITIGLRESGIVKAFLTLTFKPQKILGEPRFEVSIIGDLKRFEEGINDFIVGVSDFLKYDPTQGKMTILVNLILKGDNLENSELDLAAAQVEAAAVEGESVH